MRLDKIPPTHRTMRPDKIEPTHPETAPTLPDWVRNTGVCPTRDEFDQFVDKEGRRFRSRIDPQLVNGKGPLDCNKARTLAAVPTNVLETAYNGCELGEGAHPLACDDQRALRSAVEHADSTSAKKMESLWADRADWDDIVGQKRDDLRNLMQQAGIALAPVH
jgi:hypothetical protein